MTLTHVNNNKVCHCMDFLANLLICSHKFPKPSTTTISTTCKNSFVIHIAVTMEKVNSNEASEKHDDMRDESITTVTMGTCNSPDKLNNHLPSTDKATMFPGDNAGRQPKAGDATKSDTSEATLVVDNVQKETKLLPTTTNGESALKIQTVRNPYAKTSETRNDVSQNAPLIQSSKDQMKMRIAEPGRANSSDSQAKASLPKRNTEHINIMNSGQKRTKTNVQKDAQIHLLVEGYAFYDDIIGVAHKKTTGEEAFNLTLRNMIIDKELEEDGFSAYATLRDKTTGKNDEPLTGTNGYPKYLFLSINVHHFCNATEAADAVIQQCQKLHAVSVTIINGCTLTLYITLIISFSVCFCCERLPAIQCTIFLATNTIQSHRQATKREANS